MLSLLFSDDNNGDVGEEKGEKEEEEKGKEEERE
jgi:hypothetical protein